MWIFTGAIILFFFLELTYFKIADHFKIVDKPNLRSSHNQITIRGGGIIFPLSVIIGILIWQHELWLLALAVLIIALISFLDDILTLNSKLRILIQFLAVLLLIYQVSLITSSSSNLIFNSYSLFFIIVAVIFIIGIINAYNFMDGINGITVIYSITTIISIWFIQDHFGLILLEESIYLLLIAAFIVFGFFNLRKKAKTFAGDIGSISVAFIICYLMLLLINYTQEFKWMLLLGVYGLDAVATIFCRIIRKENIFDAHRTHFYQYLANEQKWSHVLITIIFSVFQILLNLVLVFTNHILPVFCTYLMIIIIYIMARLRLEGKKRLFKNYNTI